MLLLVLWTLLYLYRELQHQDACCSKTVDQFQVVESPVFSRVALQLHHVRPAMVLVPPTEHVALQLAVLQAASTSSAAQVLVHLVPIPTAHVVVDVDDVMKWQTLSPARRRSRAHRIDLNAHEAKVWGLEAAYNHNFLSRDVKGAMT